MNMYDVGRPERERIRHVFTLGNTSSNHIKPIEPPNTSSVSFFCVINDRLGGKRAQVLELRSGTSGDCAKDVCFSRHSRGQLEYVDTRGPPQKSKMLATSEMKRA